MASKALLRLSKPSICSQCSRTLRQQWLPYRSLPWTQSRKYGQSTPSTEPAREPILPSNLSPSSDLPPSEPPTLVQATRRKFYPQPSTTSADIDTLSPESPLQDDMRILGRSQQYDPQRAPSIPPVIPDTPLQLSPSIRQHLTTLAAQQPHYAIMHIHGRPYLVTRGDSIRLPFLMHGVSPGDVLRLTRASILGSREWTLKGGLPSSRPGSNVAATDQLAKAPPVIGRTEPEDLEPPMELTEPPADSPHAAAPDANSSATAHAFFKRKSGPQYLDERFFVCRATVIAHESEPRRVKIKKKPRNRRTRHVYSKHYHTILRISELEVKTLEDLEAQADVEVGL